MLRVIVMRVAAHRCRRYRQPISCQPNSGPAGQTFTDNENATAGATVRDTIAVSATKACSISPLVTTSVVTRETASALLLRHRNALHYVDSIHKSDVGARSRSVSPKIARRCRAR
jgi:hypothetical protein